MAPNVFAPAELPARGFADSAAVELSPAPGAGVLVRLMSPGCTCPEVFS